MLAPPRALTPAQASLVARNLAKDRAYARDLRRGFRRIGTAAARDSRAIMRSSGDRRLARSARALKSDPWPTAAAIRVSSSTPPFALATIWGTGSMADARPTGWNAGRRRSPNARPQHPRWVGKDWPGAVAGRGPRGLNDAAAVHQDRYGEMFIEAVQEVMVRAFPSGTIK